MRLNVRRKVAGVFVGQARESDRRITFKLMGPLQFLSGVILGQVLFALTVTVPGLVGVAIALAIGAPDSSAPLVVFLAAGISVTLCAAIGALLGRRHEFNWPFVVGAVIPTVWPLMRALLQPSTTVVELETAAAFICAGAAFAIGFWHGRHKRDAVDSSEQGLTAEAPVSV